IATPPRPEPSHASAAASAGTERALPASAAIALRPTETIHNPPNEHAMQASATVATTHDWRVSMVGCVACDAVAGLMRCSAVLPAMPGLYVLRMSLSANRYPLRRDMRWQAGHPRMYSLSTRLITRHLICHGPRPWDPPSGPRAVTNQ